MFAATGSQADSADCQEVARTLNTYQRSLATYGTWLHPQANELLQ